MVEENVHVSFRNNIDWIITCGMTKSKIGHILEDLDNVRNVVYEWTHKCTYDELNYLCEYWSNNIAKWT